MGSVIGSLLAASAVGCRWLALLELKRDRDDRFRQQVWDMRMTFAVGLQHDYPGKPWITEITVDATTQYRRAEQAAFALAESLKTSQSSHTIALKEFRDLLAACQTCSEEVQVTFRDSSGARGNCVSFLSPIQRRLRKLCQAVRCNVSLLSPGAPSI